MTEDVHVFLRRVHPLFVTIHLEKIYCLYTRHLINVLYKVSKRFSPRILLLSYLLKNAPCGGLTKKSDK